MSTVTVWSFCLYFISINFFQIICSANYQLADAVLGALVTARLEVCLPDGSSRKKIFNRFLDTQFTNLATATPVGSSSSRSNKENCLLHCFDTQSCSAAVASPAGAGSGVTCTLYSVDVTTPIPTTSSAGTTLYLEESDHCRNHNCSTEYGLPCVDGLNQYSCTCQSGYGWLNDDLCYLSDPYFASDFENNLAGFWNYQAAIVSGDTWGKAVEFEANDYITIQDSNQSPNFNSDKCPWSIKNCEVTGTGMSMSVTGKLIYQGVSDIQYLIYSEYGSSLYVSSAGKPTARVYRKNEWVWEASSDVDVVYESWVHWMMTWSANDGVKLYINGELVAQDDVGQATAFGNTDTVHVGASRQNRQNMKGRLDNIAVWGSELREEQVKRLYQIYFA